MQVNNSNFAILYSENEHGEEVIIHKYGLECTVLSESAMSMVV